MSNFIDKVTSLLPALGTALGGPAGGLVTSLIANAFGADPKNDSDILSKINSDPEAIVKLRQLELEHQEALQQIDYQRYVAELNDTANARNREVQAHDWVPAFLSIGFLVIYALLQAYVIYNPSTQDDVISARVQDIVMMIIGYYFGSSHTSKKVSGEGK